jgi:hypothetical protein
MALRDETITPPKGGQAMTEHERRCRQAAEALHVMRGNGVIDLPRLERILDPDREYGHE